MKIPLLEIPSPPTPYLGRSFLAYSVSLLVYLSHVPQRIALIYNNNRGSISLVSSWISCDPTTATPQHAGKLVNGSTTESTARRYAQLVLRLSAAASYTSPCDISGDRDYDSILLSGRMPPSYVSTSLTGVNDDIIHSGLGLQTCKHSTLSGETACDSDAVLTETDGHQMWSCRVSE